MILISNAANLFIMAAGLSRGREPIYPLPEGRTISDPLVQAMTLTGTAGGGMVTVEVNGEGLVKRVKIDASVVNPSDTEMLEDLIAVAAAGVVSAPSGLLLVLFGLAAFAGRRIRREVA